MSEKKSLEYTYNNQTFIIELTDKNTSLFISIVETNSENSIVLKYDSSFKMKQLQEKSNYFQNKKFSDAIKLFEFTINNNKLEIIKNDKSLDTTWKVTMGFDEEKIKLLIPLTKIGVREEVNKLTTELNQISKEIPVMKKEIHDKDLVISELEAKITSLELKFSSTKSQLEDYFKNNNTNLNFNGILNGINLNESIFREMDELVMFKNWIKAMNNRDIKSYKLLYKASKNGDDLRTLCNLCGDNSPCVILIKTNDNKRFGGYTELRLGKNLTNVEFGVVDNNSFLFSLDKKEKYGGKDKRGFGFCEYCLGFCFIENEVPKFWDLSFNNKFLSRNSYEEKNKRGFLPSYCELNGKYIFKISDVEVYHIVL